MRNPIAFFALLLTIIGCDRDHFADQDRDARNVVTSESLIDAFYSFDRDELESILSDADESKPSILFYQGWAEGGNYRVVERMPCVTVASDSVSCSVTVEDDLIGALGIDFNVTDTFMLTFSDGRLSKVDTSSKIRQNTTMRKDGLEDTVRSSFKWFVRASLMEGQLPGRVRRLWCRGMLSTPRAKNPRIQESRLPPNSS